MALLQKIAGGGPGCGSSKVSRSSAVRMSSLTSSTTVSMLMRPAMWPTKYTSMPTQTKASRMPTVSDRCGMNSPSSCVRTVRSTISA